MKNILALALLCSMTSGCSLLERRIEEDAPAEAKGSLAMENEVARLNSKIEALETKVEVLTNSLEKERIRGEQPSIQAAKPAANNQDMAEIADAPKPIVLEDKAMPTTAPQNAPLNSAEKEFQQGMEYFQNGRNLEAASTFATFARKYDSHPLAAHALYWAGEANARNKQWTLAIESWSEIENTYNKSAYIAEALAGLSRAYDAQGNRPKALAYRTLVQKSFPASPVALSSLTVSDGPAASAVTDENNAAVNAAAEESEE